METYKLTYFNPGRGIILGESIRFLFHAANVPFEDVRLEEDEWMKIKNATRWELLPMLEVGDVQIYESSAIARFLATRFGMAGSNDIEAAHIDEIVDVCKDIRYEWRKFITEKDDEKIMQLKQNLLGNVFPKYLPKFENMLQEKERKWLVGKNFSWADFIVVNFLEKWEETVDSQLLEGYPELLKLRKSVFEIPGIKSYLEKSRN